MLVGCVVSFLIISSLAFLLHVIVRKRTRLCHIQGRLTRRIVIVTGANSGIGLATAAESARRGAWVVMACRDVNLAKEAKYRLLNRYGHSRGGEAACRVDVASPEVGFFLTPIEDHQLIVEEVDLTSLESVRCFADRIVARYPKVDFLINNAGIMYQPFGRTREGFELHVGVNYLAHFLLTLRLLPALRRAGAAAEARIINVSSLAHRFGRVPILFSENPDEEKAKFNRLQAYADSKLAQVIHARELARRLKGTGVCAVSLHPGTCLTNLVRLPILRHMIKWFGRPFMKSAWEGAQTTMYAVMSPQLQSGGYYSDCKLAEPNPLALDEVVGRTLWTESERAIDLFLNK